jgi:hypothetical protein
MKERKKNGKGVATLQRSFLYNKQHNIGYIILYDK